MELTQLESILPSVKGVFLDSYGVIKNHNGLIKGMDRTMRVLEEREIPFKVLTNDASRSQKKQAERFNALGITQINPKDIVTSGMMAHQYLTNKFVNGKIGYVGTNEAAEAVIKDPFYCVPIHEITRNDEKDLKAIVFLDDEGYDWSTTINQMLNLLRRENIPVIIANTDLIYPVSKNDVSLATGGIAHLVEMVINRNFIKFGKPDSPMFEYAYRSLLSEGHNIMRRDILMIGDTLHTDILGGNKYGTKTALVLSGNTSSKNARLAIEATGVRPDYVLENAVL